MKELIIYEENRPKVLHDLKDGRVDYIDLTHWDFTDRFFAFLLAKRYFEWCAESYPTPRKKEEVPVWFLLCCAIQMKLHTEVAYDNLPGILRSGAILSRVKFNVGLKGGGFNYKNKKEREVPVDQDTVRKYFKATDSEEMMSWYNEDVVGWFRHWRGFDKEGIGILDKTYLFVPDNPNYENTSVLPFDEHDNLVDVDKLSPLERGKVRYKRCYALTSLLHTNLQTDYYLYGGCHLGPGKESGLTEGEKLVDGFVERFGVGVLKLIIADREYVDGPMITKFKKRYKIDTLLPLRSNMNALEDAKGLASVPETKWELYSEERDESGKLVKRKEVVGFEDITSWDECEVPLYVVLMKVTEADGREHIWGLASTRVFKRAAEAFDYYKKRPKIEERHRQFKGCWLIDKFTSTDFSLVTTHVVLSLMVYSMIEFYLMRRDMQHLANKMITTLRAEEQLGKDAAIVYSGRYFATFDIDEYSEIIVNIEGEPRRRFRKWLKEFRKYKVRLKSQEQSLGSKKPGSQNRLPPPRAP